MRRRRRKDAIVEHDEATVNINCIASRLKQYAIKHTNLSSTIKTNGIDSFNKIVNAMTPGSEPALRKLTMGIRAKDGDRFAVTVTHT